jgi:hypothetical protein
MHIKKCHAHKMHPEVMGCTRNEVGEEVIQISPIDPPPTHGRTLQEREHLVVEQLD